MDQRIAQRYGRITVALAKVSRRVFLIIEGERLRLVHVGRRRSDYARHRIVSGIQRRGVDEWFKDRTRLTKSIGSTIQLTLRIIAAANHRDDLAGFAFIATSAACNVPGSKRLPGSCRERRAVS